MRRVYMQKRLTTFLGTLSNKSYFKVLFRMFLLFQVILLVSNILIFLFIKRVLAYDIKTYNTTAIHSIRSNVEDTFLEMIKVCTSARLPAQKVNEMHNFKELKPEQYIMLGEIRKEFVNLFSTRRSYDKWFYYNMEKDMIIDASGVYNSEEYLYRYYKYMGITEEDFEQYVGTPMKPSQVHSISTLYEKQLMQTLSEPVIPFIYSYQESLGQKSILVINYSLKNLEGITSRYLTSDQMGIVVTDENGDVLSLVGNLSEEGMTQLSQIHLQESRLYIEQKKLAGKKYVIMSHKMEFPNWNIHISLPSSIFYRKSNMIFFLLMLANLSIAVVGISLAYGFSRRLFSPIYNLFSMLYPQKTLLSYRWNQNELELIGLRLEEIKQSNLNFSNRIRCMEPIAVNGFLKKVLEQKDFLKGKQNIQFLKENTCLSTEGEIHVCDVRFVFHPLFIRQISNHEKEETIDNIHSLLVSMLIISMDQVICVDIEPNHMVFLIQCTNQEGEDKLLSTLEELRKLFIHDTDNIRICFMVEKSPNVFLLEKIYSTINQQYVHIPLFQLSHKVWLANEEVIDNDVPSMDWDKLDNIIKMGEVKKVETFIEQQIVPWSKKLTIKSMEMIYQECYKTCRRIMERENWECPCLSRLEELDVSQCFSIEEYIQELKRMVLLVYGSSEKRDYSRREEFIKYIEDSFMEENLSLEFMAEYFQLSANHFSKVFKEQMGVSFSDYLASYRVEQAKNLLVTTKETVNEVAAAVGISNRVTFNRLFNKLEGIPPGQYRTIHRNKINS